MIEAVTRLRAPLNFFLAACLVTAAACSHRRPAPAVVVARKGWHETGVASWYGEPYHGRRAADGSIYDMNKLTAAHRTLAFGTVVRVERLDNHKRVEVRITDRGPFVNGRIIDLSRAAAEALDMTGIGIAKVRITVLRPGTLRNALPREGGEEWAQDFQTLDKINARADMLPSNVRFVVSAYAGLPPGCCRGVDESFPQIFCPVSTLQVWVPVGPRHSWQYQCPHPR